MCRWLAICGRGAKEKGAAGAAREVMPAGRGLSGVVLIVRTAVTARLDRRSGVKNGGMHRQVKHRL